MRPVLKWVSGWQQFTSINEVDPAWVAKEKAREEGPLPFVSTNDALSSWFFRNMESDTHIMLANFRSRQPSVLNLSDNHVGNYEANVPYFPGDVETPALIRQSIRDADGAFRAKRAGFPETRIPGFRKLLLWENVLCENDSPTHIFFNPCRLSPPAGGLLTLIKDNRFGQNNKFS